MSHADTDIHPMFPTKSPPNVVLPLLQAVLNLLGRSAQGAARFNILQDAKMPAMQGLGLVKALRDAQPERLNVLRIDPAFRNVTLGQLEQSFAIQCEEVLKHADRNLASTYQMYVNVLETLPSIIDRVSHQNTEKALEDYVRALQVIHPATQPTLDARAEQLDDAVTLQDEFMKEEAVLDSAGVAKMAGFSQRNPFHTASRWKKAGELFSINYRGKHWFPSFQLGNERRPYPILKELLSTLRTDPEITDWDIALWFTSETGWLNDQTPKSLLPTSDQPSVAERLRYAAEREAATE